jgi:hypothetical protein
MRHFFNRFYGPKKVNLHQSRVEGPARTRAGIIELLSTGKASGYQGHHIFDVSSCPEWASSPRNIVFVKAPDHLAVMHQGSWAGYLIDAQR